MRTAIVSSLEWAWSLNSGTLYLIITDRGGWYLYLAGDRVAGELATRGTLIYPDHTFCMRTRPFNPQNEIKGEKPVLIYVLANVGIRRTPMPEVLNFMFSGVTLTDPKVYQQIHDANHFYKLLINDLEDNGVTPDFDTLRIEESLKRAKIKPGFVLIVEAQLGN